MLLCLKTVLLRILTGLFQLLHSFSCAFKAQPSREKPKAESAGVISSFAVPTNPRPILIIFILFLVLTKGPNTDV